MASAATNSRQLAHELVDRIPLSQVSAVVGMMETMLGPVSHAIANAPYDDEPADEEETREIAASRVSLARGEGIPVDVVLPSSASLPKILSAWVARRRNHHATPEVQ
jgi:hypothetical protein